MFGSGLFGNSTTTNTLGGGGGGGGVGTGGVLIGSNNPSTQDESLNDFNDSVACMEWVMSGAMKLLTTGCWDNTVRIYDIQDTGYQGALNLKTQFQNDNPVLSMSWKSDLTGVFIGSIDGNVKLFDVNSGQSMVIGKHDGGVKSVYLLEQMNILMSLSFDKTIRFWNIAQPGQPVFSLPLLHKVYMSDFQAGTLLLGLSDEKWSVIDINMLISAGQNFKPDYKEPILGAGSQITAISLFQTGTTFAVASQDGRANVSNIVKSGMNITSQSIITFKCHKRDNEKMLYPVHGIGSHPNVAQFVYTGGADGAVHFWDTNVKNKIKSFQFQAPVTRMKMSPDGLYFAYALGYDWAQGIWGAGKTHTKICVHRMIEKELKYQ